MLTFYIAYIKIVLVLQSLLKNDFRLEMATLRQACYWTVWLELLCHRILFRLHKQCSLFSHRMLRTFWMVTTSHGKLNSVGFTVFKTSNKYTWLFNNIRFVLCIPPSDLSSKLRPFCYWNVRSNCHQLICIIDIHLVLVHM